MTVRKSGSLGRPRRLAIYITGIGLWLTGGLWLIYHYFLVKQGEFGPEMNPMEPWWLRLHGAFAFAAIWLFGLLWGIHITKAWPHKRSRWSGGAMTGVLALLTVTGYLLYYVGDDRVRPLISAVHWTVGLACPLVFLWHRVKFRKHKRQLEHPAIVPVRSIGRADG
jgi:membrane protein YdbS with pleckstrin-like domain